MSSSSICSTTAHEFVSRKHLLQCNRRVAKTVAFTLNPSLLHLHLKSKAGLAFRSQLSFHQARHHHQLQLQPIRSIIQTRSRTNPTRSLALRCSEGRQVSEDSKARVTCKSKNVRQILRNINLVQLLPLLSYPILRASCMSASAVSISLVWYSDGGFS